MKRILWFVLLVASSGVASAELVGFRLSGAITQIYTYDQTGGIMTTSSVFKLGRTYNLTLVYESSTPPGGPGVPQAGVSNVGRYSTGAAIFSYDGGVYTGTTNSVGLEVYNDSSVGDYFRIFHLPPAQGFGSVDGHPFAVESTYFLELHNPDGKAFTSIALPAQLNVDHFKAGNTFLALRYSGGGSLNVVFSVTSITTLGPFPGIGPAIIEGPSAQTVAVGGTATFGVVAASANGAALSYQWHRNGVEIPGATGPVLTISSAKPEQAGTYAARVTQAGGGINFSSAAILEVVEPPRIVIQPADQFAPIGGRASFSITASGPNLRYQWLFNGTPVVGAAELPTLVVANVQLTSGGAYSCRVTNNVGSVISAAGQLTVQYATLANLSVRATVGPEPRALAVGFVIAGSASKNLVLRGIGPSLAQFGVPRVLAEPALALYDQQGQMRFSNRQWNGSSVLVTAFNRVGAFPLAPDSRDSALSVQIDPGTYTARLASQAGDGAVLLEMFDGDSGPAGSRLRNMSALGRIGSDADPLLVGFVVGGNTTKTFLVRAIGPSLLQFGITDGAPRPQLTLFNAQGQAIAENAGWSGTAALESAFTSVGAFALSPLSRDAALLVSLPAGPYTLDLRDVGRAQGTVLLEFYETP